jgi:TM2 domain-containing protein
VQHREEEMMSYNPPPDNYGQQPYQPQYQQPYAPPPMQPQTGGPTQGYDWTVALVLSILVGELGVDRFYTGSITLGILKLLTFGGCGIWWIIDIILIVTGSYKDAYGRPLVRKL